MVPMPATIKNVNLAQYIRDIPDFPKPGILFRDITPLLASPEAFHEAVARMAEPYRGGRIDLVVAAEARGFIFAGPLALELNVGLVPIRKPGKLPFEKHSFRYDLEYGQDTLEVHTDSMAQGKRILVVDDLLATGGTVEACCRLAEMCGATVAGCAFLIELADLRGAQRIAKYHPYSVLKF